MAEPHSVTLSITGLNCAGCAGRAERALGAVAGVAEATVNLATETGHVRFDAPADLPALVAALGSAGYPAAREVTDLRVEGMNCASCAGRVERGLRATGGVLEASVNLATRTAQIRYLRGAATPGGLARAVTALGYPARPRNEAPPDTGDRKARETRRLGWLTLVAAVLALPVFVLEMGGHVLPAFHHWVEAILGAQNSRYLQFVLTTLVLFGPGRRFFSIGYPALLRGAPEMNSLVALGTTAAWGYSVLATFVPGWLPEGTAHVYFEAAAVIVVLILFGRWMEARARGRTGDAVRKLVGLQPSTARVGQGGSFVEIPVAEIAEGDILQIRPGERVATDARVISGSSFVDESMITGEPVPVARGAGGNLVGGTVNGKGALLAEATHVGADTTLARIVAMVEAAQGAKLPIQSLVDRITGLFVPTVLAAAVLTVAGWLVFGPSPALGLALVAGVAVLIIACPCAMGLATPTSIMVGTGRAAELGVLFRRGDALQMLQQVSLVAFDKTGTLTQGRPELTDLELAPGADRGDALRLTAAAEAASEHPIAAAIVRAAESEGVTPPQAQDFSSLTGYGVQAVVEGRAVLVGADRLMARQGVELGGLAAMGVEMARRGRTPLYLAVDGLAVAALGVADPVRPSAAAAVTALRAEGVQVAMITGDNRATAQAVAVELGISQVLAELLPGGKLAAIEQLRGTGDRLAFVGDGINDAPALAAADIGIAIGTGTDIAIEAADVVLISGDPGGVVTAIRISRATMRNIRQNLGWAFGYNILLIPVAAGLAYPFTGLLLSPMLGAGAMALSSVLVVSNALRLRWAGKAAGAE
ncbi:MAG: copper-translocating P-type ATPase [Rhodobacteraceae bacterium]|nr:copper-translocating P-type ATPase [Paracoccaceae bacterium]